MPLDLVHKVKPFVVHESVGATGRPWVIGMERVVVLYQNMLYRSGESVQGPISEASASYWVDTLRTLNFQGLVKLDIEHFTPSTNAQHREALVTTLHRLQPSDRTYQVGLYGIAPEVNYWNPSRTWTGAYDAWKANNAAVASVAAQADVLFPSLYTFYPDQAQWSSLAFEVLTAAQAYGKRVVPVLWPQYHNGNKAVALRHIDPEFWWHQLMTVYRMCGDVLIWKLKHEPWDENAVWLQVTREFMRRYATNL